MHAEAAWRPLAIDDPEPEWVLARFEAVLHSLGERRTFLLPDGFDFYGARNQELIAGFNRRMLEVFRAVTPPGEALYVLDPDLHHISYRFFPHVPFERGATLEQWWGFVHYLESPVWMVPLLPDGDSQYFVSPAFDFAVLSLYATSRPLELVFVGAPLLQCLDTSELPELLRRCLLRSEP